jgi:hypothetical protein
MAPRTALRLSNPSMNLKLYSRDIVNVRHTPAKAKARPIPRLIFSALDMPDLATAIEVGVPGDCDPAAAELDCVVEGNVFGKVSTALVVPDDGLEVSEVVGEVDELEAGDEVGLVVVACVVVVRPPAGVVFGADGGLVVERKSNTVASEISPR